MSVRNLKWTLLKQNIFAHKIEKHKKQYYCDLQMIIMVTGRNLYLSLCPMIKILLQQNPLFQNKLLCHFVIFYTCQYSIIDNSAELNNGFRWVWKI